MKHTMKIAIVVMGLLVGTTAVSGFSQMMAFENPLIGKQAPDFTLKNLSRVDVNYKKLAKDKNSILFFWATWCPHCRQALKEFNGRKDEFQRKNIEMILVDVGEEPQKVEHHVERNHINFDVLLDTDSAVGEEYDIIGYPTFVFVDKTGKILDIQHELPEDFEELFGMKK